MSEEEPGRRRTRRPLFEVEQTEPRPLLGALMIVAGVLVLVLVALMIVFDVP